jgi:hypothetical protein
MTTTLTPTRSPPDAGVIEEARNRQRRQRCVAGIGAMVAAGVVTLGVLGPPGGGGKAGGRPPTLPPSGGRNGAPLSASSQLTKSISSAGISLRVPRNWFGRSAVLSAGSRDAAAWLQVSSFSTQRPVGGEDPIKAMGPSGAVLTVSEDGPFRLGG